MSGKSLEINYEVQSDAGMLMCNLSSFSTSPCMCDAGDVRVQLVRLQAQLHDREPGGAREELSISGALQCTCCRVVFAVGL